MALIKLSFLIGMLVPLLAIGEGMDQCVKRVFGGFCLGGTLSQQLVQKPVAMQPRTKGERSGVIYDRDNEKIYVMAYKGVIYKILHTYEPRTLVTLKDLRSRLQDKYGVYQEHSRYPDNTPSRSRQIRAVRRGEGEIRNIWQLPEEPWRVELTWDRKLGISVVYFLNQLDAQQKEAARQGL